MTAKIKSDGAFGGNRLRIEITGAASAANGGQGNLLNPFGVPVLVRGAELHTLVASTGAATLSAAVGVASGAGGTDLLDTATVNGLAANHVYNCFAPQGTAKTAISAPAVWTATTYLSLTASATMVGYHGYLLLDCIPLETA